MKTIRHRSIRITAAAIAVAFMLNGCGIIDGIASVNPLDDLLGEPSSVSESSSPTLADVAASQSSSESEPDSSSSEGSSGESSSQESSSSSTTSYADSLESTQRRMLKDTIKYYELNSDTVGWLYIPGTTVDESVVRSPTDNNDYYLRRTNLGVESTGKYSDGWYGCYYTDYRTSLGDRLNLSKNIVIYGHSMTDNSSGERFAQLNKFRDINFCRSHPYIYFSTIESEMVWEVFAIFYCNVSFKYNLPNPTNEQFLTLLQEVRQRSMFDFDVAVSAGDRILTLSTCTYNVVDEYPNSYRMVVMARLMNSNEALDDTAGVTVNLDMIGPDDAAVFASAEAVEDASSEG